jgi:maltodextrin utilization protein YvdJ
VFLWWKGVHITDVLLIALVLVVISAHFSKTPRKQAYSLQINSQDKLTSVLPNEVRSFLQLPN